MLITKEIFNKIMEDYIELNIKEKEDILSMLDSRKEPHRSALTKLLIDFQGFKCPICGYYWLSKISSSYDKIKAQYEAKYASEMKVLNNPNTYWTTPETLLSSATYAANEMKKSIDNTTKIFLDEFKLMIMDKPNQNKPIVLDHDNNSGKARGALCNGCNVIVGYIEKGGMIRIEQVEKLRKKAVEYINNPPMVKLKKTGRLNDILDLY